MDYDAFASYSDILSAREQGVTDGIRGAVLAGYGVGDDRHLYRHGA